MRRDMPVGIVEGYWIRMVPAVKPATMNIDTSNMVMLIYESFFNGVLTVVGSAGFAFRFCGIV